MGLIWLPPDPILEAGEDSAAKRAQRANRAAVDVIKSYHQMEQGTVDQLGVRLATLRQSLLNRLAGENLTEFKAFTLQRLLSDVDQMIADTTVKVVGDTEKPYAQADELGNRAATEPLAAAQLQVHKALPGLDQVLVQAAFGNTVDLLTTPMQQFATQVKQGIRRVALGGDNKFEEIQRLRGQIEGQGMDAAQYKAERIIRTELGRVFNQATYEKMVALSQTFPFLRKGWRATQDRRTRQGHVQAGKTYGRGHGILMADLFKVNVYDERDKTKAPVLIGVASLRFPVDPQATPAGKVAAGATIMCRCNAFVDMDVAKFADYSKQKVQLALGGVEPPALPPAPPVTVPKPKKTRVPKVAKPKPGPAPAAQVPNVPMQTELKGRPVPIGPKVSAKIKIPAKFKAIQDAYDVLDTVHGDGPLYEIPFKENAGKNYGHVIAGRNGITELAVGPGGRREHPRMTTWHETGHWLDYNAIGKGGAEHPGFKGTERFIKKKRGGGMEIIERPALVKPPATIPGNSGVATWTSEDRRNPLMAEFRDAVENSASTKGLLQMHAKSGDRRERKFISYLLEGKEQFARAYAQWIATRSGDPSGLLELDGYRNQAATNPNIHKSAAFRQWSDEDFKPIGEALDRVFEKVGWRK